MQIKGKKMHMYVKDASCYLTECAHGTPPICLFTLLSKPQTEGLLGKNILMIWGHWNVGSLEFGQLKNGGHFAGGLWGPLIKAMRRPQGG